MWVEENCQYLVGFIFAEYDNYLELLSKEYQRRICDYSSCEYQFALYSAPLTEAEENLQMELLEI